jgi:hypothetical protein
MRAKRSRAGTMAPPLAIFPPISPDDLETPIGKKFLQGRGFPKIKTWQLLVKDLRLGICRIRKGTQTFSGWPLTVGSNWPDGT